MVTDEMKCRCGHVFQEGDVAFEDTDRVIRVVGSTVHFEDRSYLTCEECVKSDVR